MARQGTRGGGRGRGGRRGGRGGGAGGGRGGGRSRGGRGGPSVTTASDSGNNDASTIDSPLVLVVELNALPTTIAAIENTESTFPSDTVTMISLSAEEKQENNNVSEKGEMHTMKTVQLQLASWDAVHHLIAWFRDATDCDKEASLRFSPLLSKHHRAKLHSSTASTGLGALVSHSSGVSEDRRITVCRRGSALATAAARFDQVAAHPEISSRAALLYAWAREAGVEMSRDESIEIMAAGVAKGAQKVDEIAADVALNMPDALAAVWKLRWPQQQAIECLCSAIATGDSDQIHKAIASAPAGVLSQGIFDAHTGVAPLHLAAGEGHVDVVEVLLAAGAPVNGVDGGGVTALQVARKYDHSDVEGVLLRAGAVDDRADEWNMKCGGNGGGEKGGVSLPKNEKTAVDNNGATTDDNVSESTVPAPEMESTAAAAVEAVAEGDGGVGVGSSSVSADADIAAAVVVAPEEESTTTDTTPAGVTETEADLPTLEEQQQQQQQQPHEEDVVESSSHKNEEQVEDAGAVTNTPSSPLVETAPEETTQTEEKEVEKVVLGAAAAAAVVEEEEEEKAKKENGNEETTAPLLLSEQLIEGGAAVVDNSRAVLENSKAYALKIVENGKVVGEKVVHDGYVWLQKNSTAVLAATATVVAGVGVMWLWGSGKGNSSSSSRLVRK